MCLEDTVRIPLHGRGGVVLGYAIIDAVDAPWVNRWRWSLSARGYAYRSGTAKDSRHYTIWLHREVLGLTRHDGFEGDHINRNRLDCRRSNLRPLAKGQNSQNQSARRGTSSKYRGVSWDKSRQKWMAHIDAGGRFLNLGRFTDESEAAKAAKEARIRLLPYAVD